MQQRIDLAIHLDGVTPEVRIRWDEAPILAIGDPDLIFPRAPAAALALADDLIECLQQIRTEALKRTLEQDALRLRSRAAELSTREAAAS